MTCTFTVTNLEEIGVILVDPEDFTTAGGSFSEVTGDGPVDVDVDTQFASPGSYVIAVDMYPDPLGAFPFGATEFQPATSCSRIPKDVFWVITQSP